MAGGERVRRQTWFIRRDGAVAGPYPSGMIRRFVLLGRLHLDSDVSPDGAEWCRLRQVAHLVPQEMRRLETAEDYRRLELARRREDERRGGGEADPGVLPAGRERRAPEPEAARRRRAVRERNLAAPAPAPVKGAYAAVALLAALALAAGYLWLSHDDAAPMLAQDCAAAAAPGVDWSNCNLEGARLAGADLRGARIVNADLHGAQFQGAVLADARLAYSDLGTADLRLADLRGAVLLGAGLRGADLGGARLGGADLSYADLRGARIDGVSLAGATLGKTIWVDGRVCAPASVGTCR